MVLKIVKKKFFKRLWRQVMTYQYENRFELHSKNSFDWYIATLYRIYIAPMASKTVRNRSLRSYDATWWRHNTNMKSDLNSNYKILWIDILQAYIGSILLVWHQRQGNRSLRGYDVTWWRHNNNIKSDLNSTYKILWIDILQAYFGSILLLWHQKQWKINL